jgi:hypothetical protein
MIFTFDRQRFTRMIATAMLLLSALVLAECGGESGTYQGGSDSAPRFRR